MDKRREEITTRLLLAFLALMTIFIFYLSGAGVSWWWKCLALVSILVLGSRLGISRARREASAKRPLIGEDTVWEELWNVCFLSAIAVFCLMCVVEFYSLVGDSLGSKPLERWISSGIFLLAIVLSNKAGYHAHKNWDGIVFVSLTSLMILWRFGPYVLAVALLAGLGFYPMPTWFCLLLVVATAVLMWKWGEKMADESNKYDSELAGSDTDEDADDESGPRGDTLTDGFLVLGMAHLAIISLLKVATWCFEGWTFSWWFQMIVLAAVVGSLLLSFELNRDEKDDEEDPDDSLSAQSFYAAERELAAEEKAKVAP